MVCSVVLLTEFDWVPLVRFELWWFDKVVVYFQAHQNIIKILQDCIVVNGQYRALEGLYSSKC